MGWLYLEICGNINYYSVHRYQRYCTQHWQRVSRTLEIRLFIVKILAFYSPTILANNIRSESFKIDIDIYLTKDKIILTSSRASHKTTRECAIETIAHVLGVPVIYLPNVGVHLNLKNAASKNIWVNALNGNFNWLNFLRI